MKPQIVHEAEVHRQHVRLRIPIAVEIDGTRYSVDDWSMGGFGVASPITSRRDGERFTSRLIFPFDREPFDVLPGVTLRPLPFAHDREGSHGFVIEGPASDSRGCRIGYATDLGRVPVTLIDEFCDLDVLAIESNYDPVMQQTSGRPFFLQQRIMGGKGHLSNQQAFDTIRAILDRCERTAARLPSHIVLLHRSRQCNCPKLVRRLFSRDARIGPRLTLAEQFAPSGWLKAQDRAPLAGEQLSLAWG